MTTKHTPGPWTINKNIGRNSEMGIVAAGAPCIIAIMGNQNEWPEEAQANAILISRAPALLKAAEALLDKLEDLTTAEFSVGGERKQREALRREVQKAKGIVS